MGANLLNLLGSEQVEVYPPISSRSSAGCDKSGACDGTWVERWIQLVRAGSPKSGEDLPAVVFAVRELGVGSVRVDLAISKDAASGDLSLVVASSSQAFRCPAVTMEVPTLVFAAEAISLRDGRLLAHLDEIRPLRPDGDLTRTIVAMESVTWERGESSNRARSLPTNRDVECPNAWKAVASAFDEVRRSAATAMPAVDLLLKSTLAPLLP
jgi:hypothetical protein